MEANIRKSMQDTHFWRTKDEGEGREINEYRLRWQNRGSVNFHLHSRTSRLRRLDIKGNEGTAVRVLKRGL